jgi:hypothetical protein
MEIGFITFITFLHLEKLAATKMAASLCSSTVNLHAQPVC